MGTHLSINPVCRLRLVLAFHRLRRSRIKTLFCSAHLITPYFILPPLPRMLQELMPRRVVARWAPRAPAAGSGCRVAAHSNTPIRPNPKTARGFRSLEAVCRRRWAGNSQKKSIGGRSVFLFRPAGWGRSLAPSSPLHPKRPYPISLSQLSSDVPVTNRVTALHSLSSKSLRLATHPPPRNRIAGGSNRLLPPPFPLSCNCPSLGRCPRSEGLMY